MSKEELEKLTDKEFEMFIKGINKGFDTAIRTLIVVSVIVCILLVIAY